tara:strand:+ start:289 stop:1143 length:855 start_codon:yes stop_codon:yes gene_type:complete
MELFNKKFKLIILIYSTAFSSVNGQDRRNETVDAFKYLPTLTFQEGGLLKISEKNFPIPIDFNTHQDANGDEKFDPEDNIENMITYVIGPKVKGTGRTGLENRGPNNQVPTVYFNYAETYSHNVYQYWYYYGENSHLENHEHDWESIFIYERDSIPVIVQLTSFGKLRNYGWKEFQLDDGHLVLGVRRGDHSFKSEPKNGVVIRYNGEIHAQEGLLYEGDGLVLPWIIYSSNDFTQNTVSFDETYCTKFCYGDLAYPRSGLEMDLVRKAPWRRRRWRRPRKKDR